MTRRLYALAAEFSIIARWVVLKALSLVVRRLPDHDAVTIRIGNALFGAEWPLSLFDDYESYVRGAGSTLEPYIEVAPLSAWLLDRDILDLGSGLGQYSSLLRGNGARRVVSLEIDFDKARWSAEALRHVVNGTGEQLPFPDATFDTVFSHTVFEHIADVSRALREVNRVLRPNGIAMLAFNFIHHRGGHHLFPYIQFPWPLGVASEEALCGWWSKALQRDQSRGRMGFYPHGCTIESLSEGSEIHLNRMNYEQFENAAADAQLRSERRVPSEAIARAFPRLVARSPFRYFLTGTIYYMLRKAA